MVYAEGNNSMNSMKTYNIATLPRCQPLTSGLDEFDSNNSADISMMVGSNNLNDYLGVGFDDNSSNQLCYGTIDVPPQFPYFSPAENCLFDGFQLTIPIPTWVEIKGFCTLVGHTLFSVMHSSLLSTPTENLGVGVLPSLVDYQWSSPCETTKNTDSIYVQSCKPTIKDVTKSVNGAGLGESKSGRNTVTNYEASRATSKKRKAIEQLIHAQKLKAPGKKSQKLSDKITALQELVCPYGKTDTASVLQEACLHIEIIHQEIRRLAISYFEGRSLLGHLPVPGNIQRQGDLQSKGLCLVPISIMKRVTREGWSDQQTETRNIRRPNILSSFDSLLISSLKHHNVNL